MTTQTDLRSDETPLTDAARNVAQQAEQTVEAKASTSMDQLTTAVDSVSHAVRRAGEDLRREQPQIASLADTAADQVDRLSEYLHQHEPREVFDALEDTARRQPALLIAGGIALGLMVGRLLRTAARSGEPDGGSGSSGYEKRRFSSSYETSSRSSGYARASTGNGGSPTNHDSDPGATIVAGTRVVRRGSEVDTGTSRGTSGR